MSTYLTAVRRFYNLTQAYRPNEPMQYVFWFSRDLFLAVAAIEACRGQVDRWPMTPSSTRVIACRVRPNGAAIGHFYGTNRFAGARSRPCSAWFIVDVVIERRASKRRRHTSDYCWYERWQQSHEKFSLSSSSSAVRRVWPFWRKKNCCAVQSQIIKRKHVHVIEGVVVVVVVRMASVRRNHESHKSVDHFAVRSSEVVTGRIRFQATLWRSGSYFIAENPPCSTSDSLQQARIARPIVIISCKLPVICHHVAMYELHSRVIRCSLSI